MKFAKWVFLIAGIYGILVVLPLFFLESQMAPLGLVHPEYYYGFAAVTLAWQVLFILLSTDPMRFRPLIPAAILEKAGFAFAMIVLFILNRIGTQMLFSGIIDGMIGILFLVAYLRTGRTSEPL